jgi:hypothetical protein
MTKLTAIPMTNKQRGFFEGLFSPFVEFDAIVEETLSYYFLIFWFLILVNK